MEELPLPCLLVRQPSALEGDVKPSLGVVRPSLARRLQIEENTDNHLMFPIDTKIDMDCQI